MSVTQNINRVGNLTSSQAYKIAATGRGSAEFSEAGLTYINTRVQERKRKKSMSLDQDSMATAWGDLMEIYVSELIYLDYQERNLRTKVHPKYPFWTGTPDFSAPDRVADVKGYYPEKFCNLADCIIECQKNNSPEALKTYSKKDKGLEYWQLISNALIHKVEICELILIQPYDSMAEELCKVAESHMELNRFFEYFQR